MWARARVLQRSADLPAMPSDQWHVPSTAQCFLGAAGRGPSPRSLASSQAHPSGFCCSRHRALPRLTGSGLFGKQHNTHLLSCSPWPQSWRSLLILFILFGNSFNFSLKDTVQSVACCWPYIQIPQMFLVLESILASFYVIGFWN